MTARVAYAWLGDDDKWRLSVLPPDRKTPRPINTYESQQALIEEAGQRGLQLEWQ